MNYNKTNKEKGDLLEDITADFFDSLENTKITKKAKIQGTRSQSLREVDVLIEGQYGSLDVKIAIEAKNYSKPVGVEKVESLKTKLEDIVANLGIMVCSLGFTEPAKALARAYGIQLFQAYDNRLKNADILLPLRYVESELKDYQVQVAHRAIGSFELPVDVRCWRFEVKGKMLNIRQIIIDSWNKGLFPQSKGKYTIDLGVMLIRDYNNLKMANYLETKINVEVDECYFLKLFPISFLHNLLTDKKNHQLIIDLYPKRQEMINNGWKQFSTLDELNKAADIKNQPKEIQDLIIKPKFTWNISEDYSLLENDKPVSNLQF